MPRTGPTVAPPVCRAVKLRSRRFGLCLLLGAVAAIVPGLAEASRPVRKTVVGCVQAGVFTSADGYRYNVWLRSGGNADLLPWNGQRVRMRGSLLPGDRFILHEAPTRLGPCRLRRP